MNCPNCQHERSMVIRTDGDRHKVLRQRQCCACGWRWRTVEITVDEHAAFRLVMKEAEQLTAAVNAARGLHESG